MLADIGLFALIIAFILAVYATFASAWGGWKNRQAWLESTRNATSLLVVLGLGNLVFVPYLYVRGEGF